MNKHAEEFYKRHCVEEIQSAAESGLDMTGKKVMTTKYCLKHQFNICPKVNLQSDHSEPLYLIDENKHQYELKFNCAKCEMEIYF